MTSHELGPALETTYTARSATGAVSATADAGHQVGLFLTPDAMRMHPDDLAREILRVQAEAQAAARAALRDAISAGEPHPTPGDEDPLAPSGWLR